MLEKNPKWKAGVYLLWLMGPDPLLQDLQKGKGVFTVPTQFWRPLCDVQQNFLYLKLSSLY
jgi:hypothetical protein